MKLRPKAKRFAIRLRLFLSTATSILAVLGIVTFSNFILEEAIQTTIFGSWQAKDDWALQYRAYQVIKHTNGMLHVINSTFGWINPFSFIAYREYGTATDYWLQAKASQILANAPELMAGQVLDVDFIPKEITTTPAGTFATNGSITYLGIPPPPGQQSTCRVKREGHRTFLEPIPESDTTGGQ